MKLGSLIGKLSGSPDIRGIKRQLEVTGVVCDSRKVREGHVFVAVSGHALDGMAFADDAVARGAIAVVCPSQAPPIRGVCQVRVASVRNALAELATVFHDHPSRKLNVLGVTGTNGKTTVTCLLRDILRRAGREPGLIGTIQYEIGSRAIPAARTTPDAADLQALLAQMLRAGCDTAVMEVSSHALDQHRTDGILFDAAAFTNLTRDHLDYHGDMHAYFAAKARLFRGLDRNGKKTTAVINTDDPWGIRMVQEIPADTNCLRCGLDSRCDVQAAEVELSTAGSRMTLRTPWGEARLRTRLLGRYNVSNVLTASALAGSQGIPLAQIAATVEKSGYVPGRLEGVPTGRGFQVFVDYAHTDDALTNVLTTLRDLRPHRLICVFGCGGNRDKSKRPAMGAVAASLADLCIVTSDNPRREEPGAIIADILAGIPRDARCEAVVNRRQAIELALREAMDGDIVLIAGKGHEAFQEFAHQTLPFDDREVVRELLGTE